MNTEAEVPRLLSVLKTYAHTSKLKSGELADPRVQLDFVEVEPIHRAFAPMARTQAYDVSEMAIVTYLQAKAYNKPLVLLPAVVAARLQHGCIIYNAERGLLTPAELAGKKVGVRAYTQTTGMWVRAILAQSYGVSLEQIEWVTFEGSHLDAYQEPSFSHRAAADAKLLPMLRAGELDAAILGNDLPDEAALKPLIVDAKAAGVAWRQQHGYVPINHMVVMRQSVVEQYPQALRAVYELLKRGKIQAQAAAAGEPDKLPFGVAALREPMQEILDFCASQQLLPRKLTVDEIFETCIEVLGDAAQ
jgi:4,5-dihydroxyphthalate decarboxylase